MAVYRKKLVDKDGNTIIPAVGDIYGQVYTATLSSATAGGVAQYDFTPDTPMENNKVYAVNFPAPTVNNATIILGDGVASGSILVPPVSATNSPNYELLTTDMINNTEPLLLMYNGVQWVCLNQKKKTSSGDIDWVTAKADTDVGDGLGWVYLGQTRLTSSASSLTFIFPKKYDNYKVIFGGELASGSDTWNDLRFYNGTTALTLDFQVQDISNGVASYATYTNVNYAINGNCSEYDIINLGMYSVKTASTQWRKYQGSIDITGSGWRSRRCSGRFRSNTDPDRVTIITGGTYRVGSVLKVWGSDNT